MWAIILLLCASHPEFRGGRPVSTKSKNYCKGKSGYYYSPGNHPIIFGFFPLEVDGNSFEVLARYYAKDKNHVFYGRYTIDANPTTFKVLSERFAKDDKYVFFEGAVIEKADASSFYLNETGVPLDKKHVFVYEPEQGYIPSTLNLDRASIEKLHPKDDPTGSYAQWALVKDKNGVYWGDTKLPVDVNSFHRDDSTRYNAGCWRDKKGRYCEVLDASKGQIILKKCKVGNLAYCF